MMTKDNEINDMALGDLRPEKAGVVRRYCDLTSRTVPRHPRPRTSFFCRGIEKMKLLRRDSAGRFADHSVIVRRLPAYPSGVWTPRTQPHNRPTVRIPHRSFSML